MRFLSSILLISTLIASAFAQTADTQAKLISAPKFVLSSAAEQAGIDGALSVALRIDKTGAPKNVRVLGGPSWPCSADPKKELEAVREAVKENVQQARFSPVLKKGEPVESDLVMTFLVGNAYRSAMKESEAEEAVKKRRNATKDDPGRSAEWQGSEVSSTGVSFVCANAEGWRCGSRTSHGRRAG